MYRRFILCTLYGAVDFLNVLKKGCWGGGGRGGWGCYWYLVKYIMYLQVMVGKKHWYIMYYIMYQYFTLDTNIKFASTGDRNRIASITGGHST